MELRTLMITNDVETAKKIEKARIDLLFIDLEINGKKKRQGHLDTVISDHSFEDIKKIKKVLTKTKILTRINPPYEGTKEEVEKAILYGSDIIMLPMFKKTEEVEKFIKYVDSRVETCLLLETSEALCKIDEILKIKGIDTIHIGLNDLHLSLGLDFMFELLTNGIVEYLSKKIIKANIKLGIGGIARIGEGLLPAEKILLKHIQFGSSQVILSRTFSRDLDSVNILKNEVKKIKEKYNEISKFNTEKLYEENKNIEKIVKNISLKMGGNKCIG